MPDVNAKDASFDLRALIKQVGLDLPDHVLVNLRHFEDVDRIGLADLSGRFSDIWYPDSDDIEIIHPTCQWVIVVSHDGHVRCLRFV